MVNEKQIRIALKGLGIKETDCIFVHSSLKSFGEVEGGAETVISALKQTVCQGTLLMPAFCQKNFAYAYKTWDVKNSPSDVGIITECFRKMQGVLRSDQATHSVCAFGKNASYFTKNHGAGRKRIGIYGDTPFAYSSPYEKMYEKEAKVLFLGVDFSVNTFSHFVEYKLVNDILNSIEDLKIRNEAMQAILTFEDMLPFRLKTGEIPKEKFWLNIYRSKAQQMMEEKQFLCSTFCGESKIVTFSVKDYVDFQYGEVINSPQEWLEEKALDWFCKYLQRDKY